MTSDHGGAIPAAATFKLYLVDASAYVYRAFHAVPFPSLGNRKKFAGDGQVR